MPATQASRIQGLGDLIRRSSKQTTAPVEAWDPPYCGDIGLEIDTRGDWHYQKSAIKRLELVKLFARVLRCEKNGHHFLVTPVEKVDVAVADAPFLAVEMQADGLGPDQRLTFRTNVDDVVVAGPDHPLLFRKEVDGDGLKPYVRVRGRLYARLTRSVYFDLVELASEGDGKFAVMSDRVTFPIVHRGADTFYNFDV